MFVAHTGMNWGLLTHHAMQQVARGMEEWGRQVFKLFQGGNVLQRCYEWGLFLKKH